MRGLLMGGKEGEMPSLQQTKIICVPMNISNMVSTCSAEENRIKL